MTDESLPQLQTPFRRRSESRLGSLDQASGLLCSGDLYLCRAALADRSQIERWASLVKAVPEVEYVGVDLAIGHRTANFRRVPYPTMPK